MKIWKGIGLHIGNLIKVILFTYDPSVIVIGGSIANAYSFFAPSMLDILKTFPYEETVKKLEIRLSTKEDISILGASLLH